MSCLSWGSFSDRDFHFANRTQASVTQVHLDVAREAFNHVHPRVGSRGEMHVEALMFFQPSLHFWMLVRGVVVDDRMQLKVLGRFTINLFEKHQPFLVSVWSFDATDQASSKIVQHCEQGDGAVADITCDCVRI